MTAPRPHMEGMCQAECPSCKARCYIDADWWKALDKLDMVECDSCHKLLALHQWRLRQAPWVRLAWSA